MEEQDTGRQRGSGGRMAGTALAVFLFVYFLFPVALIWPLFHIYGRRGYPPTVSRVLGVLFWPVDYLDLHVPPYRSLLEKEADWLGIH